MGSMSEDEYESYQRVGKRKRRRRRDLDSYGARGDNGGKVPSSRAIVPAAISRKAWERWCVSILMPRKNESTVYIEIPSEASFSLLIHVQILMFLDIVVHWHAKHMWTLKIQTSLYYWYEQGLQIDISDLDGLFKSKAFTELVITSTKEHFAKLVVHASTISAFPQSWSPLEAMRLCLKGLAEEVPSKKMTRLRMQRHFVALDGIVFHQIDRIERSKYVRHELE